MTVICRDHRGSVDSRFTALFTFIPPRVVTPTGPGGEVYAYLRDGAPSATSPSAPTDVYTSLGPAARVIVSRTGRGEYSIELIGRAFTAGGNNFQVDATGPGPAGCNGRGHNQLPDRERIFVVCAIGTAPTDTPFVLIYSKHHSLLPVGGGFAYAWSAKRQTGGKAVQPPRGGATPAWALWSANSAGAANVVGHPGRGRYAIFLPKVGKAPDTVQVTPYGEATRRCVIDDWGNPPRTGNAVTIIVRVNCYDASGRPTDSFFSAAYANAPTKP